MADQVNIAQRFMVLFAGYGGAHGTHGKPYQEKGGLKWEIKRTARTVREPVTLELWEKHLSGERPLGVISIREDNSCLWGSIDIDKYDDDLAGVVEEVEREKLPLVPCRSKSGGLHLFLFLQEPQPAAAVQDTLRNIAASLGMAGSEIFPKQTEVLAERGDLGNWMVMPYFGSTYDGKLHEQVGVKKTGAEMSSTEFLRVAEKSKLTNAQFEKLGEPPRKKGQKKDEAGPFSDGPPCLQHMSAKGFPEGGRNNALFHVGVYMRRKYPTSWKEKLEKANHDFMKPPLSSEEVMSCQKSLSKKEYEYTCKNEPMCSHCDTMVCRTRKFGVGDEGNFPIISSMSKLDTRPVIWFVDVMGRRLEMSTEQLQNYHLFQRLCMDECDHMFQPMKQGMWHMVVSEAMKNSTLIEASPDIGIMGRFQDHLEDFLTNRQKGKRKEDLFNDRPWEDEEEGRHYFKLNALKKFLTREDFMDERGAKITSGRLSRMIQKLGGDSHFFNVKGRGLRVWYVPSDIVSAAPVFDPPPVPGSEV